MHQLFLLVAAIAIAVQGQTQTCKTTASAGLNVRSCASTGCGVLRSLPWGTTVVTDGSVGRVWDGTYTWAKLSSPLVGWCVTNFLGSCTSGGTPPPPTTTGGTGSGDNWSTYPSSYSTNGYTYTGVRAQITNMLRAKYSASATTYSTHDVGPTWSVDWWCPGAPYGQNNGGNTCMNNFAEYMKANRAGLKLKYLIWKQRIFGYWSSNWEGMADRGSITANHYDHIHITYYDILVGNAAESGITLKEEIDINRMGDMSDDIFDPSVSSGMLALVTVGSVTGLLALVAVVVAVVVYKRRSAVTTPEVTVQFL